MGRVLAASLAVLLMAASGMAVLSLVPPPSDTAAPMSLWEAYSRGHITITQVDLTYVIGGVTNRGPLGFDVSNTGTADVIINEFPMLLSPNPREGVPPLMTTQDGVLDQRTIAAGSTATYGYGDFVAQGIFSYSPWWCTEERQYVKSGIHVTLGGELLPFALEPIVRTLVPNPGGTQDSVWLHLKTTPAPVVGKTVDSAFWKQIPQTAGQTLQVVIRATNLAIKDDTDNISPDPNAPNARVSDVIPSGFTLDLGSITPGYTLAANPDGSKTISWNANLPAANVTGRDAGEFPTPYTSRTFWYRVMTPALPVGRLNLPRAQVSAGNDATPEAQSAMPVLDVFRVNLPPVANAGTGYEGVEGDTITFSAAASTDPNGDPLQFRWDFEADGVWDTGWSASPVAPPRAYGDDFSGRVRVEASDGELTSTAEAPVTVRTANPVIEEVRATASGDLFLRVAGEKWHDVTLEISQGGTTTSVSVVRMPGSPNEQMASIEDVQIDLAQEMSVTVYYTPMDDPVNGRPWGANPVWVIFATDGGEIRLHHTFNVRHEDSWTWSLEDILAQFVGRNVQLSVTASDIGSDDLTFGVDWGDGSSATQIVFNNGASADPFPSVEVNPIRATLVFTAAYAAAGTYLVTVTVTDDDGGTATATVTLHVG